MGSEFKLYYYRHNPFFILACFIILGCLLQNFILSEDNIESVKEALSVSSEGLIYQNFAIDTITFLSMVYFIYCSASSIINDKKNGVFIYSFVKNIPPIKILIHKLVGAYVFVVSSNLFLILFTSIVTLLIYGWRKEMIINAFLLLIAKSYTSIFYVTLAILFALVVNNYVFVLSVLFIIEMAKIAIYSMLNEFSFSKFIILDHIDISYFFNLPSTGIDRGYSLPFTLLIYMAYIIIFQLLAFYTFNKKRGMLI
ncbi:hypothetical protein MZM54_20435 [[Brevibacterium] frigoritolerans]|uniref:hypothetical protein n=1 Tax=Peribacillus frigoritolerans TaxID=450367 RepID=UPI0020C0E6F3|nr:hypothetical protein [Peribacillus frigoritolerans]MCK2003755.1 hypothetical protein [Peribacillus frigoritolerans]